MLYEVITEIVEFMGEEMVFNEGCLSVPGIREDVSRPSKIRINYLDRDFKEHEEIWEGTKAIIVQHEYDHLEGKIFIDRVSPIKRRLLKGKLAAITKGKNIPNYKVVVNK